MNNEVEFFQTMQKRIVAEFPKSPLLHKDQLILTPDCEKKEQHVRFLSIENLDANSFHPAIIIQQLGEGIKDFLKEIISQVKSIRECIDVKHGNMILSNHLKPISSAVFSQIIYIYSDQILKWLAKTGHKIDGNEVSFTL